MRTYSLNPDGARKCLIALLITAYCILYSCAPDEPTTVTVSVHQICDCYAEARVAAKMDEALNSCFAVTRTTTTRFPGDPETTDSELLKQSIDTSTLGIKIYERIARELSLRCRAYQQDIRAICLVRMTRMEDTTRTRLVEQYRAGVSTNNDSTIIALYTAGDRSEAHTLIDRLIEDKPQGNYFQFMKSVYAYSEGRLVEARALAREAYDKQAPQKRMGILEIYLNSVQEPLPGEFTFTIDGAE